MAKKSYNGYVLPDITDVWNNYLYPYAFITIGSDVFNIDFKGEIAELYVLDSTGYITTNENGKQKYNPHSEGFAWKYFVVALSDDAAEAWSILFPGINAEYWIPIEDISGTVVFSGLAWTNTTLYDEKGNLILEASKPVQPFYLKDWLTGFLLGFCGKPLAMAQTPEQKEPVAYLYNGVVLPKLPEWDRETYPYAVIGIDHDFGYRRLVLSVSDKKSKYRGLFGTYYDDDVSRLVYIIRDTEFDQKTDYNIKGSFTLKALWANHDIVDDDSGEIIMPASEPVQDYTSIPYCYYNENKMPALPELDMVTCPYAIITHKSGELEVQHLVISGTPFRVGVGTKGNVYFAADSNAYAVFSNWGSKWEELGSYASTFNIIWDGAIWSSHDIIDTDGLLGEVGSVYFAGSDPVPIYE